MNLKLTNGAPSKYTLGQLRRDGLLTSFPKLIPDDLLASFFKPEGDKMYITGQLTDVVRSFDIKLFKINLES